MSSINLLILNRRENSFKNVIEYIPYSYHQNERNYYNLVEIEKLKINNLIRRNIKFEKSKKTL